VILVAASAPLGFVLGLAGNAASVGARWPGVLDVVRRYPWWSAMVACAACVVAAVVLWWADSRAGPVPEVIVPPVHVHLDSPVDVLTSTDGSARSARTGHVVVGEVPRMAAAFQPRPALMARLEEVLGAGQAAALCATTGAGKTQAAAAYARQRIADGWPVVVWLAAESAEQIVIGLDELAGRVGVRPADADPETSARAARQYLAELADRSLLVFDNATDPDAVAGWIPAAGRCSVVVTSTRQGLEAVGTAVQVDLFTDAEAVAYLRQRTGRDDDAGARIVAAETGFLPLALSQAATVIRREALPYALYVQRVQTFPVARYLPRTPGDPYPRGVAEAILLSVLEIESRDKSGLAGLLLRLLSVLSATGVNKPLLAGLGLVDAGILRAAGVQDRADVEQIDAALTVLVEASVATRSQDGATTSMHRLIARTVRDRARQQAAPGRRALTRGPQRSTALAATIRVAILLIDTLTITGRHAWNQRAEAARLIEHIDALWTHVAADMHTGTGIDYHNAIHVLGLRRWTVRHFLEIADPPRAIAAGTAVLADCEQILGAGHPHTLAVRNNLGYAHAVAGRLDEAIRLYQQTLTARTQILGTDHPLTLTVRSNLADAYRSAGRLDDAIDLHQQTLADRTRILGTDHPRTLTSRSNLGHAYAVAGRLHEAIRLYQQTLADRTRVLGPDHPDTLITGNNLGYAYGLAGRHDAAIELHQHTIAQFEHVLGADHPDTLASRSSLADAYRLAGRRDEAIDLYRRVLSDRARVLGNNHPQTLAARTALNQLTQQREK
jgi:tetratricopeptide (TPR) repeat protein